MAGENVSRIPNYVFGIPPLPKGMTEEDVGITYYRNEQKPTVSEVLQKALLCGYDEKESIEEISTDKRGKTCRTTVDFYYSENGDTIASITKEFVKIGKEKEMCCCQYVITDGIQYSDWFGEGLVEERRPAHDSCIPKKKPIKMSLFCR